MSPPDGDGEVAHARRFPPITAASLAINKKFGASSANGIAAFFRLHNG
jgi:hypothetical protein